LLGALTLGMFGAFHFGVFSYLANASHLRGLIVEIGPLGPLLFVALFSTFEAFGVPGLAFVGIATVIWPLWMAILLSWAGGVSAAILGFAFARTIGREWVQRRMPPRFHRYDQQLAGRGLISVISARLVFFMAPPVHWMFGLSSVGWPAYLVGSALGLLPGITLVSITGKSLLGYLRSQSPLAWIVVGVAGAALMVSTRRLQQVRVAWERKVTYIPEICMSGSAGASGPHPALQSTVSGTRRSPDGYEAPAADNAPAAASSHPTICAPAASAA
jgi:uncharacterized membrane protein YdjX (TVP38/TMEM64 family)